MDEDLRKSIRNLGRGFHAGRFSTRELLDILHIDKVYIASGMFHGVFFNSKEVIAVVKHYAEIGYFITQDHQQKLEDWAAGEKQGDISLDCPQAREWFPPEDRGKSDLDITVIDFQRPQATCCHHLGFVAQLSPFVTSTKCPNNACQEVPCVQHIMVCNGCEKDLCPGCVATFVDERGVSVDAGSAMCADCHPKCSYDDPCNKCISPTQGDK